MLNKYCLINIVQDTRKRHAGYILTLLFIGNRKSGNNDGGKILSLFRRLLNPAQVVDLAERDPVAALEWCRLLGKTPSTILVAGGDGTVAWLLNTINKLELEVSRF